MLNFEEVLNNIKISVTESIPQTNLFTPMYKKVRITIKYNDKSYSSCYQCNAKQYAKNTREQLKKDFVWCVYMDAKAYENSCSFEDFCKEFGYEPYDDYSGCTNKSSLKIYKACQKASDKLQTLFTQEEIEALEKYYEEY